MINKAVELVDVLGTQTAVQLRGIEAKLESALALSDVQLLYRCIAECKELLHKETLRLSSTAESELAFLHKQQTQEQLATERLPTLDSVTGLPDRASAEAAIARSLTEKKEIVLALFLVGKMGWIRARFGKEVGDDVLRTVAAHIGPQLREDSILYHWWGPSFLAVLNRNRGRAPLDRELKEIAAQPLEKTIDTSRRNVLLPITLSCSVLRLSPNANCNQIVGNLEEIVSSAVGNDPSINAN